MVCVGACLYDVCGFVYAVVWCVVYWFGLVCAGLVLCVPYVCCCFGMCVGAIWVLVCYERVESVCFVLRCLICICICS